MTEMIIDVVKIVLYIFAVPFLLVSSYFLGYMLGHLIGEAYSSFWRK